MEPMQGFWGALAGALIGGLITSLIGIFTLRFSYNDLYAKTISSSRNEWITIWRDEVSKFLAISDMLRYENFNKDGDNSKDENIEKDNVNSDYLKMLEEYHISKNKILMRLNLDEKKHQEVYLLINKIAYENGLKDDEYKITKECLMAVTRDLLKEEWERVKLEARGKKNGK